MKNLGTELSYTEQCSPGLDSVVLVAGFARVIQSLERAAKEMGLAPVWDGLEVQIEAGDIQTFASEYPARVIRVHVPAYKEEQ